MLEEITPQRTIDADAERQKRRAPCPNPQCRDGQVTMLCMGHVGHYTCGKCNGAGYIEQDKSQP